MSAELSGTAEQPCPVNWSDSDDRVIGHPAGVAPSGHANGGTATHRIMFPRVMFRNVGEHHCLPRASTLVRSQPE